MPPDVENPPAGSEDSISTALAKQIPDAILTARSVVDGPELEIARHLIGPVCAFLKSIGFERVSGITGVDWWPRSPRFEVVYLLHSVRLNQRVRLVVRVAEGEEIDSISSVWRGANWYEREVFDLFGVRFRNHPYMERIMMPVDWEGHPLRKDYPVHGHKYSYSDE